MVVFTLPLVVFKVLNVVFQLQNDQYDNNIHFFIALW